MGFTLRDINKEAIKHGLNLVRGKGYFYWAPDKRADEETANAIAGLFDSSVPVFNLFDLSLDQWLKELKEVVKKVEEQKQKNNDFDPDFKIKLRNSEDKDLSEKTEDFHKDPTFLPPRTDLRKLRVIDKDPDLSN